MFRCYLLHMRKKIVERISIFHLVTDTTARQNVRHIVAFCGVNTIDTISDAGVAVMTSNGKKREILFEFYLLEEAAHARTVDRDEKQIAQGIGQIHVPQLLRLYGKWKVLEGSLEMLSLRDHGYLDLDELSFSR